MLSKDVKKIIWFGRSKEVGKDISYDRVFQLARAEIEAKVGLESRSLQKSISAADPLFDRRLPLSSPNVVIFFFTSFSAQCTLYMYFFKFE